MSKKLHHVIINFHLLVVILLLHKENLIRLLINTAKKITVKLVFNPFKIGTMFTLKDSIPDALKSNVVYKFSCAGCNACYIGETTRHLATRIKEHLQTDKSPMFISIFTHLKSAKRNVTVNALKF